ncbi:hypothetical protein MMC16_006702 [Acarospora aff. strigata]|nr:hypothetical protein [Acarospora aff. strigata]
MFSSNRLASFAPTEYRPHNLKTLRDRTRVAAFLHSRKDSLESVNLDFDAKVPIPFSVFPSSYRSDAVKETTHVRVEGEASLPPRTSRVGREGHETRYSSFSTTLPDRKERTRYEKEEITVHEEDPDRRPRRKEDFTVYEEEGRYRPERFPEAELSRERYREPYQRYSETKVDLQVPSRHQDKVRETEIDITERDYRRRTQPTYDFEYERRTSQPREVRVEAETTVDPPSRQRSKMGYYDDEGRYHSIRHGIERAADRVLHPFHPHHHRHERDEVVIDREDSGPVHVRESVRFIERGGGPNTITIPCHHIHTGDLLIIQGRPCQVIRITTSAQTGQHRYLGVDLFSKQLHEESSFVSNPSPSVVVQSMLGPVFKQYRVLDIRDDGRVVAMTETGDVKQGLPVIDQGGLWSRLNDSFANGRGSVRVLVINDGGNELAVDYKVIHGSRL